MLTESNKQRLEYEISRLVKFIMDGRTFFFKQSGLSLDSPDDFLDHWKCKELFYQHPELIQLDLNIQLLYIKLASYYQVLKARDYTDIRRARNVFAHELTDMVFNKRINYNFFLHKVSQTLKRVEYVFYDEDSGPGETQVKVLDLELDRDIRAFFAAVKIDG